MGSAILCAGVLEAGLRLSWHGYYASGASGYARAHVTRGWENVPGIQVRWGKPEFSVIATHNSKGPRSPEVTAAKAPDTFRILVLGDSFAYGIGVEDDETFSARLGQMTSGIESVNAGVNGYGTANELVQLQELGSSLKPDLVVVAFFWNDVVDSFRSSTPRFQVANGILRYTPPAVGSEPASFKPKRKQHGLRRKSYLYRFVSDRIKLARYRVQTWFGIDRYGFAENSLPPDELEPAWELEFALLREIQRSSRALGAEAVIAVIPDQVQVQPEWEVVGIQDYIFRVPDRLAQFSQASGVPVIDLLPGLREAYRSVGEPLYYRWDRHLTREGHTVVARLILEELRRRKLLPLKD